MTKLETVTITNLDQNSLVNEVISWITQGFVITHLSGAANAEDQSLLVNAVCVKELEAE